VKNNLAPGFKRFEFRSGMGGAWGGMVTQGDPGRNPPFSPRLLINTRLVDGEVQDRPGLAKLFASPMHASDACVKDVVDHDMSKPFKLWITGTGCPGISAGTGFYLGTLDSEQEPEFQRVVYYDTAVGTVSVAKFNGDFYVGVDSELRKLTIIKFPWGTEAIEIAGTAQESPVYTFTGFTIRCLKEFDGKLFIGLDNGAGASKIATFDGVSIRDDKTAIDAPRWFALYRIQGGGDAIVCGTSTTSTIYIRPTGESPGTWTSIGNQASVQAISYKDVLYIATGATTVASWNGVTLTVSARAPVGASAVRTVTVFNSLLYFGYDTAAAAVIGKFDGSTWTDAEKSLTAQFVGTTSIRALESYRGFLVAAGTRTGIGELFTSPGKTTSGTWTEVVPHGVTSGVIFNLMAA
jgi:hypothetical protein